MNEKLDYNLHEYYAYEVLYYRLDHSKSALILDWLLPLHIKTKFQNNTKAKPHKIFAMCFTSCCHFSLAKFCQISYIIKKQTHAKNVLLMNKNLKKIALR